MSTRWAWMSNPQYLAQVGHFLGGAWVVFLGGFLGGLFGRGPEALFITFVVGLVAAALKEFVFDLASWGEGDTLPNSTMDFAFYVIGGGAGAGVYCLARCLHLLASSCS